MDEAAERQDIKRIVWGAVNSLQDNHKDVIIKRYKHNMTYKGIAADNGTSMQAARQTERTALRGLRRNQKFMSSISDYIPTRHVSLSEFKTTFTSAVEWAAIKHEIYSRIK